MISVVGFVYPYPEQCAFEFRQRYGDRVGSQWALALYGLVDGAACEPVTQESFLGLLEASFFADPVPFDPQWDSYVVPPEYPWSSWRKEYDPARPPSQWKRLNLPPGPDDRGYALEMLRFMAADLERLEKDDSLREAARLGTIMSPTGNAWANFSATDILSSGLSAWDDLENEWEWGWLMLAELLDCGRQYE